MLFAAEWGAGQARDGLPGLFPTGIPGHEKTLAG